MKTNLAGNELLLLTEKAVWLEYEKTLLIADVHLGKIEHFRKAGIGIPHLATTVTQDRLESLLIKMEPSRVIFLGDLFHSKMNHSFDQFKYLTDTYDKTEFHLVMGNHDIMPTNSYHELNIKIYSELIIGNLWLTHEPQDELKEGLYNLAGHIHPGVKLKGKARQSITLPCFYFGPQRGLLPAFGYFTGKSLIKIEKNSDTFAIAEDIIFNIKNI